MIAKKTVIFFILTAITTSIKTTPEITSMPKDVEKFLQRYGFDKDDNAALDKCLKHFLCNMLVRSTQPTPFSIDKLCQTDPNQKTDNMPPDLTQPTATDRFIKPGNSTRVIHALRLQRFIEEKKLDHLEVVKKAVGFLPDNTIAVVLAQAIDNEPVGTISLQEAQQLAILVKETGYTDIAARNLLRSKKSKKLVIIDTDGFAFGYFSPIMSPDAFLKLSELCPKFKDDLAYSSPLLNLINMYKHLNLEEHCLTPEAQTWLEDEIKRMNQSAEGIKPIQPFANQTQYDDADINFAEVQRYFFSTLKRSSIAEAGKTAQEFVNQHNATIQQRLDLEIAEKQARNIIADQEKTEQLLIQQNIKDQATQLQILANDLNAPEVGNSPIMATSKETILVTTQDIPAPSNTTASNE